MNGINDSNLIEESYCSITCDVFKFLPKKNLPFSLYRMNSSNGRFSPVTLPGKMIVSADKQTIINDCKKGLIFIKCNDICTCRSFFASNLTTVINEISHSIPDIELANILLAGLKEAADKIFNNSVKLYFKDFHQTLTAVGGLLHSRPELLWLMLPKLEKEHSLVNKAISNGIIGAAVIMHGRDVTPDLNVFNDALAALFLCDIGLCNLPEFVLGKEFCLTRDEQKRVRHHPISSLELLGLTKLLNKTSLRAILEHHERMDGSGYPRGVKNEELSWLGKLCGAVDSFVAMTMERPGKKQMPTVKALKILYAESTKYDPNIIYALEKVTYRE